MLWMIFAQARATELIIPAKLPNHALSYEYDIPLFVDRATSNRMEELEHKKLPDRFTYLINQTDKVMCSDSGRGDHLRTCNTHDNNKQLLKVETLIVYASFRREDNTCLTVGAGNPYNSTYEAIFTPCNIDHDDRQKFIIYDKDKPYSHKKLRELVLYEDRNYRGYQGPFSKI
ncbi:hypothetical protein ENBRE01_0835 [Enteropsectra breve]|nr:hypothetical protein ENBRE01_0835 [Enteropsectra breve]